MQVSITDAKARPTDLVRRAEAGDDVILTRHGQPSVRLVPIRAVPTASAKRAVMQQVRAAAPKEVAGDVDAARSQDFLYDEDGLPA